MKPKPSLYATLPIGTVLSVKTSWVGPSGDWLLRAGEVLEDQGEDVSLLITTDGYGNPRFTKQSFPKCRIVEIIRGPIA